MSQIEAQPAVLSLKRKSDQMIKNSLDRFKKNALSEFSFEKAKTAQNIFQKMNPKAGSVYLFVCGGMGGSSYLFDSFNKKTDKKKIYRIDKVASQFLFHLLKKKRSELEESRFIYISKSGKTPEILFYTNFLKTLCSHTKISLKNKVTVLTSDLKSPLAQFAKKEGADLIVLKESLPGRFSIFTLTGFLQLYFQGLTPLSYTADFFKISDPLLDFLLRHRNKKEFWLCATDSLSQNFGKWFELLWSESLFKNHKSRVLAPSLRQVSFYNLQHFCIEELVGKKKQTALVFLSFKKESPLVKTKSPFLKQNQLLEEFLSFQNKNKEHIQSLLQSKNIPFLNLEPAGNMHSLFDLIFSFYQALFVFGDLFKVNIFKNEHIDQLKGRQLKGRALN